MRTPDQIQNLRFAFYIVLGPYAVICPDSVIDRLADRLVLNLTEIKQTWDVRVRLTDNVDAVWDDIRKEPTSPNASLADISVLCISLMQKYSNIDAIQIRDRGIQSDKHHFIRSKK